VLRAPASVAITETKATATGFHSGSNSVLWTNASKQAQTLQVFSMLPGFGAADLRSATSSSSVQDDSKAQYVISLDPGFSQLFTIDLAPGTYVFAVASPDGKTPMAEVVVA
jgi:hypothetical protein